MSPRPRSHARRARTAVLAAVACLTLVALASSARAATLQADFHFNDTLAAPTGQMMAEIGPGNVFVSEAVAGGPPRRVLAFRPAAVSSCRPRGSRPRARTPS